MKREELIDHFRKLVTENLAEARKLVDEGNYEGSAFRFAQDEAYENVVSFLEQHFPANSITLALPTYAPGDPRAGEVVKRGDRVYRIAYKPRDGSAIPIDGPCEGYCIDQFADPPTTIGLMTRSEASPNMGDFPMGEGPYFSTPSARDAAMQKEDHNGNV